MDWGKAGKLRRRHYWFSSVSEIRVSAFSMFSIEFNNYLSIWFLCAANMNGEEKTQLGTVS
jgi:hypothetical protein